MYRYHVTKTVRTLGKHLCVFMRERTGTKLTGHPVKLTDCHLESTDGLGEVHVLQNIKRSFN